MSRKNKSTSFNLHDQFEVELLQYAEKQENGSFSRYVKRLITKDRDGTLMARADTPSNVAPINSQTVEHETSKEDINAMSNFL